MGELTVTKPVEYDPAVDSSSQPSMIEIVLKCSKTIGKGARIYIGKTDTVLCPVAALLAYVAIRGMEPGPLFQLEDGTPLWKNFVVSSVREALRSLGYE
jgi:hypothetical protein